MRLTLQWILGLLLALCGSWVLCWGLGGTGYQSVPSLFAGGNFVFSFLTLIIGLAFLGAAAWVVNKGTHEAYFGPLIAGATLAVVLLQKPGLDIWLKSLVHPDQSVYFQFAFESLLWQLGVILIFVLGADVAKPWHPRTRAPQATPAAPGVNLTHVRLNRWTSRSWISAGVALIIFLICTWSLVRAPGAAQAVWGSAFAAFIAATIARVNFPSRNPLPLFFIPALIGPLVYFYTGMSINGEAHLLGTWYARSLPGLANALPCHLAAGSLVGLLAGCLLVNKANEYEAESATAG